MQTLKHIGRDGAILAALAAGALAVTVVAQGAATLIITLGEMMM